LPPHERTWRHPSELAAAERHVVRFSEPPPAARALAIIGGSLGLLAIGVLLLTVTPRRLGSPIAVSATSTPGQRPAAATLARLATPIGDGRRAIMTLFDDAASAIRRGAELDVRLPSGPTVTAVVDTSDHGVLVVTIRGDSDGHAVARSLPAPGDIVTVLTDPPITVAFSELAGLDVEDGTPVLDGNGDLVGLCEMTAEQVHLLDVTAGVADEPGRADPNGTVESVGATATTVAVSATDADATSGAP
jgi:hypothetical protein